MNPLLLAAALSVVPPPADAPPVTRVFHVADLVVPVPDYVHPAGADRLPRAARWARQTADDRAEQLVRQVTTLVRPGSWEGRGGRGTVEYFEIGQALVVRNAPAVVAEVGRYLDGLRRLQDVAAATETRVVSGPAGFATRHGLRDGRVVPAADLARVLAAAEDDRGVTVTQLPKVTTFDGQTADFLVGETRTVVAGVDVRATDGRVEYVPRRANVDLGDRVTLRGRIAADEQAVDLRAALTRTALVGEPVSATLPEQRPGAGPVTVLVTETTERSVERTGRLRTGETLVVGRWVERDGREVVVLATAFVIRCTD